jgi:long-chain acyl-CoA synthetase
MTLLDMLGLSAGRVPHRPALVFRERQLTYAELQTGARKVGGILRSVGIAQGDRVVLMVPNVPEFGLGYFGILCAGGTVVPLNPLLKAEEVQYVLEDSGAAAMVCLQASYPLLRSARTGMTRRIPALVLDARAGDVDAEDAVVSWPREDTPASGSELDAGDVAVCLYTSGTTGRPKGALLTHGNLLANIQSFREVLCVTEEDVFLAVLPLFHAYGATALFLEPLSTGSSVVLEPRFTPEAVFQALAQHRVTIFMGVPSMYAVLASLPWPPQDFSSVRLCISGGAPLPPRVLEAFEARYGVPIYEGYGPTECGPVLTVNPPGGLRKVGSVGRPIPHVELRVVDAEGNPLSPGEVGEIAARGLNVMKGYLNRPEESREVLRDGWYYTGDLGRMDEDGYFYILDRKQDMILVGGLNVYPREVELVLSRHPAVAEAAVIGVPDPIRGEAAKALVTLRDGQAISPHELLQWCRERLANYKVPRTIEVVPELPKTLTGKILKTVLREAGTIGSRGR